MAASGKPSSHPPTHPPTHPSTHAYRLGFLLKKRKIEERGGGGGGGGGGGKEGGREEPVLVLSSAHVSIEKLDLKVEETRGGLSWLYNLLVSLFSSTIKSYVVQSVLDALEDHMSELLGMLNEAVR